MDILSGLDDFCIRFRELGSEFKQQTNLFLGKEEYYMLCREMRKAEHNPRCFDNSKKLHFYIDYITSNCVIRIFNKDELYRLTQVIEQITHN